MGFEVQGSRFRVWGGLRLKVWSLPGFWIEGLGLATAAGLFFHTERFHWSRPISYPWV